MMVADQSVGDGGSATKPARRFRWGRLVIAVTLLALLTVVLAPRMFGSRLVYQSLLNRLQTGAFSLSVDSIELRWLRPVVLNGITITDTETPGVPAIQIEKIAADRGLLRLLFHGGDLGDWSIRNTQVDLTLLESDGRFRNLLAALGATDLRQNSNPEFAKRPPHFHARIVLTKTEVVVRQREADTPLVVVPAFDLQAAYAVQDEVPLLSLAATRLLDDVELTPELVRAGLAFAAPLLAEATWVDGRVTADLQPIRIPLSAPLRSSGKAELRFDAVRLGIKNPEIRSALERAAKALGREPVHELVVLDGNLVRVSMDEGKVHHDGLQFGLPQVDRRLQVSSHGSVGLQDRTLDLLVEIPVPLEFIAGRDTVRQLGVPTVTLPVQGYLGAPSFEWKPFRQDAAGVFGDIAGQVADEAPAVAAIVSALGSVTGGETDQAIAAAAEVFQGLSKRLRERRQENRRSQDQTAAQEQEQRAADEASTAEDEPARTRNRPLLNRLRQRLESRP